RGQHFIKLQLGCQFIRTALLLVLATSHVIPWEGRCQVSLLTRAEFLQVIWGRHAGCVEEVLVLTDTVGTRRSGLALWCNAVDGDLGLVHRDWLKATNLGGELVHDVHIRVQAQVAGCTNHEVGTLLTVYFLRLIQAAIGWTVCWGGPLTRQHQVAIREGEVAATLVAPLTSAHRAGFILGLTGVTTRRGCRIVPVGGGHVVAIGTVFCLQLPVAVIGVGGRTTQYFQAVWGVVNEHVQDGAVVAEVLIEFHDIWDQGTKEEAAVAFKAWDATQVMAAIGAEVFWVSTIFLVLDLKQATVIGEGPAVERTGDGGAVVRLAAAQHRTTVGTRINQRVELTIFGAGDHDGLAANIGGVVVTNVWNLGLMRKENPVTFEDVAHFQVKKLFMGEHLAVHTDDSVFWAV